MLNLSISSVWNETAAFVKREAGLLFPIALALIAVPAAFLQMFVPQPTPGETPEPGSWMLLFIPVMLLSALGSLTLSVLALRPGTSVREAFGMAGARLIPLLLALLVVMIAFVLLFVVFAVIAAAAGMSPGVILLLTALGTAAALYLWARLMLVTPVAAAEPVNPMAILRRSWALTGNHVWKLLAFLVLVMIAMLVVTLAVGAVLGILVVLVAGTPEPGSLSAFLVLLLGAVVNAVIVTYFTVMIARIYAQLAGPATSGI
jgi:hypothetical protein